MKILFVADIKINVGLKPTGVMYLSSFLKKGGHKVNVVEMSNRNLEQIVKDYSPDFLAYSVCSGSEERFLKTNRNLKKVLANNVISIFGGPHPTFFPDYINEEGVDIICRGEGEEAFGELVERIQAGRDYNDVKNLWIKHYNNVIKNECRPLKENLDELPFPDRSLFSEIPESLGNIEKVMTSRGCPFNCSYCFNHQMKKLYGLNQSKVRRRSVDNVISELKGIRMYSKKVDFIEFDDDVFPVERDWLERFKERYLDEVNLPFSINYRPNVVKEENVKLLKEAGCTTITIAVESGNEVVRNEILNRALTTETILKAAKIIKKYDVFFVTQSMFGNPVEDSYGDACDTVKLNIEIQPSYAWASILNPYMGTEIWNYCLQYGYIDKSSKFPLMFHLDSPLKLKHKKKILNLYELFDFMVSYPILFKYFRFLINLPLRPLYRFLKKMRKGYKYFRYRYKFKISIAETLHIMFKYFSEKGGY